MWRVCTRPKLGGHAGSARDVLARSTEPVMRLETMLVMAEGVPKVQVRVQAKAGIAGTKGLLEKLYGYGGNPRRPLPPIEADALTALWEHPHTKELIALERELSGKGQS